jgi:hypothetical protein
LVLLWITVPSFNDNVCPETVTDINAIKANENIAKIDPVMCFIVKTPQCPAAAFALRISVEYGDPYACCLVPRSGISRPI